MTAKYEWYEMGSGCWCALSKDVPAVLIASKTRQGSWTAQWQGAKSTNWIASLQEFATADGAKVYAEQHYAELRP